MRAILIALVAMTMAGIVPAQAPYDVVIRNGRVLDGTGVLRLAAGGREAEVWDLGAEPLTGMGPT